MKPLLLIYLFLLGSQATLVTSPKGPLETYKDYLIGVCTTVGTDCDLTTLSSCWDDNSALAALTMIYQSSQDVANSPPQESYTMLKAFCTKGYEIYILPTADAFKCEAKLPFSSLMYEKLGMREQTVDYLIKNILYYVSVKPKDSYIIYKHMATLAEQGNFEAVGLLDGNVMSQAAALINKENLHWSKKAKESKRLFLKGICEALDLECSMDSLNCMNEEASAADLSFWHEWLKTIANQSVENMFIVNREFLLGKGKDLIDQIPKSGVECEMNSVELKLMNEKLGFDVWSEEWYKACVEFLKEFPGLFWYYKNSEYLLMEKNDLEGVGMMLGLEWYQIAEWKKGRLARGTPLMTDL